MNEFIIYLVHTHTWDHNFGKSYGVHIFGWILVDRTDQLGIDVTRKLVSWNLLPCLDEVRVTAVESVEGLWSDVKDVEISRSLDLQKVVSAAVVCHHLHDTSGLVKYPATLGLDGLAWTYGPEFLMVHHLLHRNCNIGTTSLDKDVWFHIIFFGPKKPPAFGMGH